MNKIFIREWDITQARYETRYSIDDVDFFSFDVDSDEIGITLMSNEYLIVKISEHIKFPQHKIDNVLVRGNLIYLYVE